MEGQSKRWIGHKRRKLSTQNYKKGKKKRKDPAYGNENKEKKYPQIRDKAQVRRSRTRKRYWE
jgi:hypothetical protein